MTTYKDNLVKGKDAEPDGTIRQWTSGWFIKKDGKWLKYHPELQEDGGDNEDEEKNKKTPKPLPETKNKKVKPSEGILNFVRGQGDEFEKQDIEIKEAPNENTVSLQSGKNSIIVTYNKNGLYTVTINGKESKNKDLSQARAIIYQNI